MKSVLFVVDTPGCAFDITYNELAPHLPHECHRCYVEDFKKDMIKKYDRVHFMNWLDGKEYTGVSGGVCSHGFEYKHMGEAKKKMPKMRRLICSSKEIYKKVELISSRSHYCPNGVNVNSFAPFPHPERRFVVGWVGQPTYGGFGEKKNKEGNLIYDYKGYDLILKPLMRSLRGEIEFKVLDRPAGSRVPHSDMPEWYRGIDCYICTSICEGGPLPVFEAAACGIPVVSTAVGAAQELIRHAENGFLIKPPKSRDDLPLIISAFRHWLVDLKNFVRFREVMGQRLRYEVEANWTWKRVARNWGKVF